MTRGVLVLMLISILRCVRLQAPSIQCPQYFQYVKLGSNNVGKITLPNITPGRTVLYVEFSQRQNVAAPNYYGNLRVSDDLQTTIKKLYNGQPIVYRVDFPTPNVLPKLTLIKVNDVVICSDTGYPPPSTKFHLTHTISSTDFGGSLVSFQKPKQNFFVQKQKTPQGIYTPQTSFKQVQQEPSRPAQNNAECGLENHVITPYIVGGQTLSPRQFPWLAAIFASSGNSLKFICGGTLVSSRTVVTAAHCFANSVSVTVVQLGRYDFEDNTESYETRNVQQIIKHPEFRTVSLPDADIALLILQTAVRFSPSIRPACLWNEQIDVNLLVGQTAAVAGWGENERQQVQSKPKKANANVVSLNECQSALSRNLISPTARAICVRSSDGSMPCRGDSGGGLVVYFNGHWILRGIVSGGYSNDRGCLLDYTFFCDLAQHKLWLLRNII